MQTEHNRQIAAMQIELGRIGDMIIQNDALQDQLRQATCSREQALAKLRSMASQAEHVQRQQVCPGPHEACTATATLHCVNFILMTRK